MKSHYYTDMPLAERQTVVFRYVDRRLHRRPACKQRSGSQQGAMLPGEAASCQRPSCPETDRSLTVTNSASPDSRGPPILDRAETLLSNYDVLFCDVWGVVHNGVTAFED